jgi:hypothetical protein
MKMRLKAPRATADVFAFIRNTFPVEQRYENTPEDMSEFFREYLKKYGPSIMGSLVPYGGKSQQQLLTETARMMHIIFRWARFNMPVFDLSEGLMDMLTMTDPADPKNDIRCDEVKLPFDTFCITIPPGYWKFDGFPVEVIWVHRFHGASLERRSYKEWFFIGLLNSTGVMIYDNSHSEPGECLPGDDSNGSIGAWISREKVSKHFKSDEMGTDDWGLAVSAKRLIVNLMLYTAERDFSRPPKQRPKRRYTRRSKQRAKELEPEVWVFGKHIPIIREINEAGRAAGGTSKKQWVLKKSYVRKGHWRRQPYGPGRSLRKIIWIKPTAVGGSGPRLTHIYDEPSGNPADVEQLELEADEAAELAEECYDQGDYDSGDYYCDKANQLFDQLEWLTGEVYE